jgi:hypothetical protein
VTATNDKLAALRFYLRRRFRLTQVRSGAVDHACEHKPLIPTVEEHKITIHHELDLCRALDLGARWQMQVLPPWSRTAAATPNVAQ